MEKYFYAGGDRHHLALVNGIVAVDARAANAAGLGEIVAKLLVQSKLRSGYVLVDAKSCPGGTGARSELDAYIHSVYQSDGVLVVPLPEVRVEFEEESQHVNVLDALASSPVAADIVDTKAGFLALRPRSGSGEDAIDLANFVYERARPASSSVRMLSIVPKLTTFG